MRREFTRKVKRQAFDRAGGLCECWRCPGLTPCGQALDVPIYYEHIIQCEVGGENGIDNCAVLNKTCWKAKTAKQDLPIIAKSKRIHDRHRGITPRRRRRIGYKLFDGTPKRGD